MTQSQIDLTDTILHILSFASVTTDLYGHRIEFVEKIIQGPKNKNLLYTAGEMMDITGMTGGSFIVSLYRKYPLKHVLLW